MKHVLITGFEPFGGETVNPSLEAVKQLDGKKIDDYVVVARQLPTVFHESIAELEKYIEELKPEVIICVGQAGGRPDITVERVAINVDDARIADNRGKQPVDVPVVMGGPVGYWATLPIKAIVKRLREQGIPASISQTAGTFVCNHVFYGLMHILNTSEKKARGGFIHIPYLPQQAVAHPGQPSMPLNMIVKGLELAVETTLTHEQDIVEVGGQTH
ncbi:pyroglutamyl-peptidase I [Aneurinibacillus thermoaerophilus]|uniref:Pyrrolidone-carboxylate peptidase n=1 Tax=Aneurinibacillus thermoaerophilus TaxID=143495 RepID=A0A1G8CAK3_ANETH|nr:pyroglutamyl-peptidase I [Aneurinibacillus thermoaerophilus]MED0675395.1 pyroglutamyl-peptidase I [Aneurinibacillus thermoaerophilus]MED0681189.1 pyroglutamyl-peptidase I [Aneurinibacillus thermoaerophilus]MED0735429.1 pyroglutamyl-peptidase I [Aneurinibacillus thermoaerophilus]MED0757321.1 pyroglutamyl-peptidase I [Aneurinibacillus thermoaerophilus]MED0761452.1 pyroglutamyl-peptidase I [Aneurinibacillus thermoaerophilus]